MISHITPKFRAFFEKLPVEVQQEAREDYRRFKQDPNYPGLNFKPIKRREQTLYSVRIGIRYRALAYEAEGMLYWFWIGHHSEYDKIIARI